MEDLDCQCDGCIRQFIPQGMPEDKPNDYLAIFEENLPMSDEDARKKIDMYKESANADYLFLVDKVTAHGSFIEKQWREMSTKKRKSFLQSNFPSMFVYDLLERCLLVELFAQYVTQGFNTQEDFEVFNEYREVLLNPCLNIENLMRDPNALLAMLKGRVQYSPAHWIAWDKKQSDYFFDVGYFNFDGYHMSWLLMDGENYGEFTPFKPSLAHCK
ncbi:hypothetical protein OCU04_010980 [Sclerotinia nivalis]|uniref:Uncharacterized protein n=1 Tax=Sclerotinia nivalis TaxID=352851 RepID=A0A9X0AD77_9HELO|nr:hypothetical protein OCU04_010980 [Sclerotinia nivalis]